MLKDTSSGQSIPVTAVIPAAGSGARMGSGRAKQYMDLNGKPLLASTLAVFEQCASVSEVVLVVPAGDVTSCEDDIVSRFHFRKVTKVVAGGRRRQDSVALGVEAIEWPVEFVLIHDGVRPLVNSDLVERVTRAAVLHGAAIAAIPAKDTIKEVKRDGIVKRTHDRDKIWLAQTPQVFRYADVLEAHRKASVVNREGATDDAALVEGLGVPVRVVEGAEDNIKITTHHDLELAGFLLRIEKR